MRQDEQYSGVRVSQERGAVQGEHMSSADGNRACVGQAEQFVELSPWEGVGQVEHMGSVEVMQG